VVRVKDALEAIGGIVTNLVLAIRGASVVALVAAVLVLGGALAAGHRHRVYDAVVLKTLGATRRRLIAAYAIEYLLLGAATAVFGVAAGSIAAWLVVTEVMDRSQIPLIAEYTDIFQTGARNMQNFNLLRDLGKARKPVFLKRGMAATIEEWLMAAEYVMSEGNHQVMLCERGIRTFETYTRNTLDISAIPVVHKLSHLPVIADPSHGTGIRDKVLPMARAAVAAGADGLMIEVHNDPAHALSDGAQALLPEHFDELMRELRIIVPALSRTI